MPRGETGHREGGREGDIERDIEKERDRDGERDGRRETDREGRKKREAERENKEGGREEGRENLRKEQKAGERGLLSVWTWQNHPHCSVLSSVNPNVKLRVQFCTDFSKYFALSVWLSHICDRVQVWYNGLITNTKMFCAKLLVQPEEIVLCTINTHLDPQLLPYIWALLLSIISFSL